MATDVHGIPEPSEFDNYASDYQDLLKAVDEGIAVFGGRSAAESAGASASGEVFAVDRANGRVWVSDGSTTEVVAGLGTSSNPLPQFHVEDLEVTNNFTAPDATDFLALSGDTMEGNIDMNGNDITGVGTLEVNGELIVPSN